MADRLFHNFLSVDVVLLHETIASIRSYCVRYRILRFVSGHICVAGSVLLNTTTQGQNRRTVYTAGDTDPIDL